MSSESLRNPEYEQSLNISLENLQGIEQDLGLGGLGAFIIEDAISPNRLRQLQDEVFDPTKVAWRDNHDQFTNERGRLVIENHLVYALKLNHGDQNRVNQLPHMRKLAADIEGLVRGLSYVWPSLADYQLDEMSLHRYDDPDVGLSFHKDNLRFNGIIAIMELEGERDFAVETPPGDVLTIPMRPGSLLLNRATGLYNTAPDENGRRVNLCPDHGVYNLRTPTTTSFIVRANTKPDLQIKGFEYDNWRGPIG